MTWRFGFFELDENRRELRLHKREVVVEPLVFDLLVELVRRRDRVVTKDELLDSIWPGTIVMEGSLQRAVSLARSALRSGDAADAIKTYPRRGYRFVTEVTEVAEQAAATEGGGDNGSAKSKTISHARRAFERNDWQNALADFDNADRAKGLLAPDLERAAWCRLNLGLPEESVPFLERAVAAHAAASDGSGAARAAILLSQIHLEGRRLTIAYGWQQRAARLLADKSPSRELAQLEWITARVAFASEGSEAALKHAERALELARLIEDLDLEAVSLIFLGHVCVARGEVRRGIAYQDEAAAAVLGGAIAPWFAGLVYCGLVYICQNRGDWARAAQWTEGFARWSERATTMTFPAVCRLHRAEVFTVKGDLATAERELLEVRDELVRSAPWAVGDAERLYGEVLRARGDLEGATQAYQRARSVGWDPCPGWAELMIERGEVKAALQALTRAVEDPSWPCRQRRRLLMASLARAAARAGDVERAREALAAAVDSEDGEITPAQHGALERARGELAAAEGRTEEAIAALRVALGFWRDLDALLEMAPLHERLADLLGTADDAAAAIEWEAAEALWRRAGADTRANACAARHLR